MAATPSPRPTSSHVSERLQLPVVQLVLGMEPLSPDSSLRVAASLMANEGYPAIPIADDRGYLGLIREKELARALADGVNPDAPLAPYVNEAWPSIGPMETAAAALRALVQNEADALAVVGQKGEVIGIVTPSRLHVPLEYRNRPQQVGGMATPFGVYLTTGNARAGKKGWELVAAGAFLFSLFVLGAHVALGIVNALQLSPVRNAGIFEAITSILFLLFLRLSPMAKIHAAEHMAVHAIEREEAISIDVLKRMPRVHPRCGTNLAVAATLFLSLFNAPWPLDQEVKLLIALIVTVMLFRPVGAFVQQYITTAPPKDKHLQLGVDAAEEMLTIYETQYVPPASVGQKLFNSGLIQIMAGAIVSQLVLFALYELLRVPMAWRVISGIS
ncbi:MAG: DUF1385 domain-containing protein [Fimbriimonadaceae bacterium]|nr:DUF1385 domain-containing protein [Fimbriimonadaceae bacterium]